MVSPRKAYAWLGQQDAARLAFRSFTAVGSRRMLLDKVQSRIGYMLALTRFVRETFLVAALGLGIAGSASATEVAPAQVREAADRFRRAQK